MRGQGKTNYLKSRLLPVSPLLIVDIRNEYRHVTGFRSIGDFVRLMMHDPRISQNEKRQYRFCFQTKRDYVRLFNLLCAVTNSTIVLDEADALCSCRDFLSPIQDLFLGSRNNNISMIFVGKRPFLIPILIRSQAEEYVIFKTEERRDIEYLTTRVKADLPKDPSRLSRGEAIVWKDGEKAKLQSFQLFSGGTL